MPTIQCIHFCFLLQILKSSLIASSPCGRDSRSVRDYLMCIILAQWLVLPLQRADHRHSHIQMPSHYAVCALSAILTLFRVAHCCTRGWPVVTSGWSGTGRDLPATSVTDDRDSRCAISRAHKVWCNRLFFGVPQLFFNHHLLSSLLYQSSLKPFREALFRHLVASFRAMYKSYATHNSVLSPRVIIPAIPSELIRLLPLSPSFL